MVLFCEVDGFASTSVNIQVENIKPIVVTNDIMKLLWLNTLSNIYITIKDIFVARRFAKKLASWVEDHRNTARRAFQRFAHFSGDLRQCVNYLVVAGTPVAAGLIDAHAGGIGSVGARGGGGAEVNLAYVFGTSSCTMTSTKEPVFVPGVWGPYYSAMVPGLWLNEGGQSAAGAAIDHLLEFHPHASEAHAEAARDEQSLPAWLAQRAKKLLGGSTDAGALAGGVHVVPDFLGNRAPHADPHTRAVIAGLGMERDLDSLVALYVAGLCGIGYGLRQIVEAQAAAGAPIERIVISGGAGRSDMIRQLLADTTGVEIAAPATEEPVLLGSAILGSVAGAVHPDIQDAMERMSSFAVRYLPQIGPTRALHDARFKIFEQLQSVARQAAHAPAHHSGLGD